MEKHNFFFFRAEGSVEVRNREFVVTPMYFYVISCKGTWLPGSRSGNLDA